jgi:hypothetical protein
VTGPLGNALGGSTRGVLGPLLGNEEERMEIVGGKNKDSYSGPEKIAGKEQVSRVFDISEGGKANVIWCRRDRIRWDWIRVGGGGLKRRVRGRRRVGDIWGCKKLDYEYLKLGVYQKRQSIRL